MRSGAIMHDQGARRTPWRPEAYPLISQD